VCLEEDPEAIRSRKNKEEEKKRHKRAEGLKVEQLMANKERAIGGGGREGGAQNKAEQTGIFAQIFSGRKQVARGGDETEANATARA